jgi:hypothetical protein
MPDAQYAILFRRAHRLQSMELVETRVLFSCTIRQILRESRNLAKKEVREWVAVVAWWHQGLFVRP